MAKRPPGKHAFIAIFITVLIDIIGFGIIIPVMPDLVVSVTNLTEAKAIIFGGYLLFVFALMQFISSPIIGAISDRFGRRPVILLSLLGYALDFVIMGFAKTYAILFIGRVLSGTFAATYATANAYIADITPPEKRAQNFGLLGVAFGLGFIIGPLIGGYVGEVYGLRAPFFLTAFLAFSNFVYCFFVLPETLAPEKRRTFEWRRANPLGNLIQLKKYPVMLPIFLAMFLAQLSHFAIQSTWSWYGKVKFDWSPKEIAYSLAAVGLTAAIVQGGLIRVILPKLGERRAVLVGGVISIMAYCGYAFATQGWMIYVVIAFGAFGALIQPAVQGIMSRTIPEDGQGELQGAISSMMSIAMIIGPLIMTRVFSMFTVDTAPIYFPGAPFLLGACFIALAGIPIMVAFSRISRPRNDSTKQNNPDKEQTSDPAHLDIDQKIEPS